MDQSHGKVKRISRRTFLRTTAASSLTLSVALTAVGAASAADAIDDHSFYRVIVEAVAASSVAAVYPATGPVNDYYQSDVSTVGSGSYLDLVASTPGERASFVSLTAPKRLDRLRALTAFDSTLTPSAAAVANGRRLGLYQLIEDIAGGLFVRPPDVVLDATAILTEEYR